MAWLEMHRDRPTFLYIHTAEPHAPYTPPAGFAGRYDPGYDGPIDGTYHQRHGFAKSRKVRDVQHVVALYEEEVAYADSRLGQFVDTLAAAGLAERTDLFIIADHGEEFLEHGNWEHGRDLHNELMRIPLVATGPTVTARGRQLAAVQLYDLMPTVLDMFDLPEPYPLAGSSLVPLMTGKEAPAALQDRTLVASNHNSGRSELAEFAVISGPWKLMLTPPKNLGSPSTVTQPFSLFNMQDDYHEQKDVIHENREVARKLIGELVRWRSRQAPFARGLDADSLLLDGDQLEELRSLGYIR